jgi:hypothetical protein
MKQIELLSLQTAAGSLVTQPIDLADLDKYAIAVIFSGGAGNLVGTLTLEGSNDQSPPTDFVTITGTSQAVATSTNHMWNVNGGNYRFVRVRWVYSSGTGNMKINFTLKENVIKGA